MINWLYALLVFYHTSLVSNNTFQVWGAYVHKTVFYQSMGLVLEMTQWQLFFLESTHWKQYNHCQIWIASMIISPTSEHKTMATKGSWSLYISMDGDFCEVQPFPASNGSPNFES